MALFCTAVVNGVVDTSVCYEFQ